MTLENQSNIIYPRDEVKTLKKIYNYDKLRGKIRECGYTEYLFAKKIKINPATLSAKFKNKSEFTQSEMSRTKEILNLSRIDEYFFNQ